MSVRIFAPAKVNLTLKVARPRADGMHPLQSVVAFADVGDFVEAKAADSLSLTVTGDFAEQIGRGDDNLVLRAAQALALADAVSPDCGVCLDAYHLNMEEADIYDAIRLAGKRLFDFHIADNNRFAAGLGHLDWPKIIGTLKEIGYDGALTNEFVAPVDRTPAAPYPDMVEKNPVDISPEQLKFIQDHGSSLLTEKFYADQMRITAETILPLIK